MATTSSSSLPHKRKNLYTLSTLSLLFLFLFCLFLFNKKALEPNLSLYRDLISTKPTPRSTLFHEEKHDLINLSENVDINTSLSKPDLNDSIHEIADKPVSSNEQKTEPISPKSNLDEKTDKPFSSNEKISEPISSKSNLDGKTDKPLSSNEKTNEPISSKSNLDEKNSSKLNLDDGNRGEAKKSSNDVVTTIVKSVISNEVVEKLRGCDFYKGKWVRDEDYPLYKPGTCPYVDGGFDCHSNGRLDFEYLKWRWKPDDCDLPRF